MTNLLGTVISHYRFIDYLGEGGMGKVYVGYDEKLNRKVALKSIQADHKLIAEAKTRFLREARILSQLAHPNICQIFDYIEGDSADFLVLELILGHKLTETIKKGLEYRQKLKVAEQIAGVLVAAHEKGIIHRDLKPDNIMLAEGCHVKVLDFGLSQTQQNEVTLNLAANAAEELLPVGSLQVAAEKTPDFGNGHTTPLPPGAASGTSGSLTRLGTVMGTLAYMSPEQARGEAATSASDLYSFGLILQELFTRKPAYDRTLNFKSLLEKATAGETLPVEGIDADLTALIKRLKSVAPAARPTAVDTAERLAWIQDRPHRRRKKILLATAIAILTLFTAAMVIQTRRAVRAERSAITEADTAKQISEFLISLFRVSDPNESKGSTITARELLDKGSQKIEIELKDQPLIQARLMDTIGNVYVSLGLYKKAEALLEKALETRESHLPPDHPDVAKALDHLASLYSDQGKFSKAKPLFQRSLAILEKALSPDHPDVTGPLKNLAILYLNQGKFADAEPLYQRCLKIREKTLGPDHPDTAASINNLAELYRSQGKFAEAEPLYRRSLAIWEKTLGKDHPDVARSLNNLAIIYRRQGNFAEAEALYLRSLAIREKAMGPDHRDVASSLNNLANLYNDQGKFALAEPLLQRSLRIWKKVLGPDHPDIAIGFYNIACLNARQGKVAEALAYLRLALPVGGGMPWMRSIGTDTDLASLHGNPEFERIVAEVQQRAESTPKIHQ